MRSRRAQAIQPSLYMARLPKISKYCWVWRSFALGVVERVGEAGRRASASAWIPSTRSGAVMPATSRIVGRDVDDVGELAAQAALVLDPSGPGDDHRVAGAAEVGGDLLAPLEGRVARPGPGAGEVRLHERAAPGVHPAVGVDELELLLGASAGCR